MENPIVEALKQLFNLPYSENEDDFVLMRRRSGTFEQVVDSKRNVAEYTMTINHVLGSSHVSGSVEGQKFRISIPRNQMVVVEYQNDRNTFPYTEEHLVEVGEQVWKDLAILPF